MVFFINKKTLCGVALIITAIIVFSCLRHNYLLSVVSTSVRSLPIYEVETAEPKLAISFDASWGAEYTDDILDILDEYQVKATFFLVNIWLEDYPLMAQQIAQRGHELGLHSATHSHMSQLTQEQIEAELLDNQQMIKQVTGCEATLFRPPFGDYDNLLIDTCTALGCTAVQWSVDSLDWKDLSAQDIYSRVTKDSAAGDIVLFHNNGLHTAEALPLALEHWRAQGLEVVPVGEIILQGDCYVDYNGIQKRR